MKKLYLVLMIMLLALSTSYADIIINEIMQNPAAVGDDVGEWFELYNSGDVAVNIDGWQIWEADGATSEDHIIDNGGTLEIAAGGYLVLGINGDTAVNGGVTVDYVYSGVTLGNSTDEVVIYDSALNMIDIVEYDNGATFPDPSGSSMYLIDPLSDNNVGANWAQADAPWGEGTDNGTPGAQNPGGPPPWPDPSPTAMVINEIIQNPGNGLNDSDAEWFEIYNPGDADVDIEGWTITNWDNEEHIITTGSTLIVPADGYAVLGINGDTALNGGITLDYVYGAGIYLGNSSDLLMLLDGDGLLVDYVQWDDGATFPDPDAASMYLIEPDLDNSLGENWATSTEPFGDGTNLGTPGESNIVLRNTVLMDPSYESWEEGLLTDWQYGVTAATVVAQTDVEVHEGQYGVSFAWTETGDQMIAQIVYDPVIGETYMFNAWAKDNDEAGVVMVVINCFDADDVEIEGGLFIGDPSVDSDEWQLLSVEAIIPENTDHIGCVIVCNDTPSWDGDAVAYVDDTSLGIYASCLEIQTQLSLGDRVMTYGVVTQGHGGQSTSRTDIYIQDESGYGVMLYDGDPSYGENLQRGDAVLVQGTIAEYSGVTELVDLYISELYAGEEIPEPMSFTTGDFAANGVAMEGVFATFQGAATNDPGTGSFNLTVNDGSGEAVVRVNSSAGLNFGPIAMNTHIFIRGVIDLYQGVPQLVPSMQSDIRNFESAAATLDNTGFEDWTQWGEDSNMPDHWSAYDWDMGATRSTDEFYEGTTSALFTVTHENDSQIIGQSISGIAGGDMMNFSAWMLDNEAGVVGFVGAIFFDNNNDSLTTLSCDETEDNADWQQVGMELVVPEGAVWAQVGIIVEGDSDTWTGSPASIYVDELVFSHPFEVTIEEAQTNPDLMGTYITVTGIVTQGVNTVNTSYTDVYVQDGSGRGIMLYDGSIIDGLDRGDEVRVSGTLAEFGGVTEIVDFEWEELSTGNALPAPMIASTGDMFANQEYEGTFVQVSGYLQNMGALTPSVNLYIDDGSGEVVARVWSSSGISLEDFERFDAITVRGVIDLYQGAVQIIPSIQDDIEESIPLAAPEGLTAEFDPTEYTVTLDWNDELDETFRFYAVYRNDQLIGTTPDAGYVDYLYDYGNADYVVRSYYDVGVSGPSNTASIENEHPLMTPVNVIGELNAETGEVSLGWVNPDTWGEGVTELSHDTNTMAGSYIWPGSTMGTLFNTEGEAEILAFEFFTTIMTGDQQFNAELYLWDDANNAPLTTTEYTTISQGAHNAWTVVDVSNQNLFVDGNFVVGFGSIDASVAVGYEEAVTGFQYAWDFSGGEWVLSTYEEPYQIRVIVQLANGLVTSLTPSPSRSLEFEGVPATERTSYDREITEELDDLIEYSVMRNDEELATTTENVYVDQLEDYGSYTYTIIAHYDEGDSEPSDGVDILWSTINEGRFSGLPEVYSIASAYPNPFNPTMTAVVGLPERADLKVKIYNMMGREVATLANSTFEAGYHQMVFNATNLASGVYLIHAQSPGNLNEIRKVVLVR